MIIEQAIEELKSDRELYEGDIVYAGDGTPDGDLMLALDMGIAALKKQIPKKPIRTNYIVKVNGIDTLLDENEFTKCPSCTYKDVEVKQGQKHCHVCGQALDWSGTDKNKTVKE